jgi:DNA-binding NarL/FixJ family response regulator
MDAWLQGLWPYATDWFSASLAEALARLERKPAPDVILLDLKLPDVDGLDGLIRLKKTAAGVPLIVVSSLAEDLMIASVVQAGASGFIPKHSQRSVFVEAFDQIWAGDVYTPEGFVPPAGHAAGTIDERDSVERLSQLTQQQARILQLVCEGKLNKQIAYELDIAETTVKAHLTAILRKLNVQSRTQAVLIAQNARFAAILHKESGLS